MGVLQSGSAQASVFFTGAGMRKVAATVRHPQSCPKAPVVSGQISFVSLYLSQFTTAALVGTLQEYRGDDVVAHHDAVKIEDVGTVGFACP